MESYYIYISFQLFFYQKIHNSPRIFFLKKKKQKMGMGMDWVNGDGDGVVQWMGQVNGAEDGDGVEVKKKDGDGAKDGL